MYRPDSRPSYVQGTHKSLRENQRAKATVGAIIDGMGSLGAACGPLITGWISDDFVSAYIHDILVIYIYISYAFQYYFMFIYCV